jgi:hypothetical protein
MIRSLRRHFGISAPRLAVRTHVAWPLRLAQALAIGGAIASLIWWGYDTGRLFAGFDRSEAAQERTRLLGEVAQFSEENARLRARVGQLEAELGVTKGAQEVLSRQTLALQSENTQIKEDLVFLQKLFAGGGREMALSVQRLQVERQSPTEYRLRLLVVQGQGAKKLEEFNGQAQVQVGLLRNGQRSLITLPDQQPAMQAALRLNFKYYQRIESVFQVPADAQVKSVQVRVLENNNPSPRVTQSLNL